MAKISVKRIGFSLLAAILAVCPALGQPVSPQGLPLMKLPRITSAPEQNQEPLRVISAVSNGNAQNSGLRLASVPASEQDGTPRNNVTFASPVISGERADISFNTTPPAVAPSFPMMNAPPVQQPQPTAGQPPFPIANTQPVPQPQSPFPMANAQPAVAPTNTLPVFQQQTAVANDVPTPVPAFAARAVAQNAVTMNHRLRIAPQVFEKNLVEKLGSRFVPVRNVAETSGITQYRLPVKDGTDIALVINKPQGTVSVTGSPSMVEASLQIVRYLDVQEVAGGPVARFVPVQQSDINAARRIADIVSRETQGAPRVAQATPPAVANQVPMLSDDDLIAAGVVGPVSIEIIDAFGTVIIQGTPEDVAIVQAMLRQLEALSLDNEPVIELVPMRHVDSVRVNNLVQQLYLQIYAIRRGPVTMLPLVKPNTILIIGRRESIDAAKELIAKIDTPVIPNTSFKIVHLKHAAATEMVNTITTSFTNRPGATAATSLAVQLYIVADTRTNALIIQANPRDMIDIESMIRQLDVAGSEIAVMMKRFQLKNMMATEMQTILTNALNAGATGRMATLSVGNTDEQGNLVRASVMYNVAITPDTRNNSLVVTAPADTMSLIAALIAELDQLPSAESKIKVFSLANASAFDLTTLLTNLFGTTAAAGAQTIGTVRPGFEEGESTLVSVRFQTDTRTNSIVAIGSEADLAIVEALLIRLDSESLNNRTVFTMKLVNQPADEIGPTLNQYFTTERQFGLQNTGTFLPNSPLEQYRWDTTVVPEPVTNSLIISTTPQNYEIVRRVVMQFDERPQMVTIDVLIAEVEIKRNKDRGIEFGLQDSILFNTATGSNTGRLGVLTNTVPFRDNSTGTIGTQGITNLIPSTATGGFSFAASSESVSVFIRALETNSRTQVLARPRLVTIHNRRASVLVGEEFPYDSGTTLTNAGSTNNTNFREVGTILDITPRVMPDGMIAMAVYVERSSLLDLVEISGGRWAPHVRNTNAQTTINAMDGETVIFAGLITEQKKSTHNSIPGLNKIPVVKHFFEYDSKTSDRSELLIILTPRLIKTEEDMMLANQMERERMQWCVSDVVRLTGDYGMRRRSDEWYPNEVRHIQLAPTILHESQLPTEHPIIPTPMFPTMETK